MLITMSRLQAGGCCLVLVVAPLVLVLTSAIGCPGSVTGSLCRLGLGELMPSPSSEAG